jgi:hypothetical protein
VLDEFDSSTFLELLQAGVVLEGELEDEHQADAGEEGGPVCCAAELHVEDALHLPQRQEELRERVDDIDEEDAERGEEHQPHGDGIGEDEDLEVGDDGRACEDGHP